MKRRCRLTDQILSPHFPHTRPAPARTHPHPRRSTSRYPALQPAPKAFSKHPHLSRPAKEPCGLSAPRAAGPAGRARAELPAQTSRSPGLQVLVWKLLFASGIIPDANSSFQRHRRPCCWQIDTRLINQISIPCKSYFKSQPAPKAFSLHPHLSRPTKKPCGLSAPPRPAGCGTCRAGQGRSACADRRQLYF